jgi:hypothetical protein
MEPQPATAPARTEENGNNFWENFFGKEDDLGSNASKNKSGQQHDDNNNNKLPPVWLRWIFFKKEQHQEELQQQQRRKAAAVVWESVWQHSPLLWRWVDPVLFHPTQQDTFTILIDKVLTSTVRLLLISNWFLALTVLLHTAVADWFLGPSRRRISQQQHRSQPHDHNNRTGTTTILTTAPLLTTTTNTGTTTAAVMDPWTATTTAGSTSTSSTNGSGGRERLGGFLLFKLLLISAVVGPDTLDLLILLSWYTVLSFLRSLDGLCAYHTSQSRFHGMTPDPGIGQLLWTVLALNACAVTVCVGLFHGAGMGMVLLLTCDCALLAIDIETHLLQHVQWKWDVQHTEAIAALEEEQLRLHQQQQQTAQPNNNNDTIPGVGLRRPSVEMTESNHDLHSNSENDGDDDHDNVSTTTMAPSVAERSRQLDHRMEIMEQHHYQNNAWLDSLVFGSQLCSDALTVAHFLHIWSWHGVQFTLIDGVLALHLHSAIAIVARKIAERRNTYCMARDMDDRFENATELDLRKAAAAGDVCCICLGTMTYHHHYHLGSSSNIKKVACGHLYHTNCLREVVERARSMDAARCPLCRSSLVQSKRSMEVPSRTHTAAAAENHVRGRVVDDDDDGDFVTSRNPIGSNAPEAVAVVVDEERSPQQPPVRENPLFRFSTENLFPAWLPLPALSFEVVRRPPGTNLQPTMGDNTMNNNTNTMNRRAGNQNVAGNNNDNDGVGNHRPLQHQPSLLRRMLVLAGAIPMSPEEENAAVEQLVDMFPQYERQDLRRALRERGSAEAVAESVLLGTFVGVRRGGGYMR